MGSHSPTPTPAAPAPETPAHFRRLLASLLAGKRPLKLGYGIAADLRRLFRAYPALIPPLPGGEASAASDLFVARGLLDLGPVLAGARPGAVARGLAGLAGCVLGRPLDKRTRMSDWERRPLGANQARGGLAGWRAGERLGSFLSFCPARAPRSLLTPPACLRPASPLSAAVLALLFFFCVSPSPVAKLGQVHYAALDAAVGVPLLVRMSGALLAAEGLLGRVSRPPPPSREPLLPGPPDSHQLALGGSPADSEKAGEYVAWWMAGATGPAPVDDASASEGLCPLGRFPYEHLLHETHVARADVPRHEGAPARAAAEAGSEGPDAEGRGQLGPSSKGGRAPVSAAKGPALVPVVLWPRGRPLEPAPAAPAGCGCSNSRCARPISTA